MALIEHLHANGVELIMSRGRTILVSLVPALLLLASVDCLSEPPSSCGFAVLCSSCSAGDYAQHRQPPPDSAIAQAVQRWNRRLSAQPGSDGFPTPAALASSQAVVSGLLVARVAPPRASFELAQCWQFHWRTALEPRAPSLVS